MPRCPRLSRPPRAAGAGGSPRARLTAGIAVLAVFAGFAGSAGCAAPYRGPRTVASIAVGVLAASAAVWVVGERADHRLMTNLGAIGTAAGTAATAAAGTWIAASSSCRVDPDCPEDEVCREIPAPPDREPFRQCSPR